jgi:hypothetical protein
MAIGRVIITIITIIIIRKILTFHEQIHPTANIHQLYGSRKRELRD